MNRRTADHLRALRAGLQTVEALDREIRGWGEELAELFVDGRKVLVAGNGGSAALAAHLTGELIGRYLSERRPLPAVWLGADQAAFTAILNDYGPLAVFARQVTGLGRAGDVLILLSSSGRSPNLLQAAGAASDAGIQVWAMTGAAPNPLAAVADRSLAVPGGTPVVQELQQVLVHLVCETLDEQLARPAAVNGSWRGVSA